MQSYGVIEPFVVAIPATSQGTVPSRGEGLDLGVRFALPHVVGLPRYLAINVQDHASAAADRLTEAVTGGDRLVRRAAQDGRADGLGDAGGRRS
jgi:hypothetical protein